MQPPEHVDRNGPAGPPTGSPIVPTGAADDPLM